MGALLHDGGTYVKMELISRWRLLYGYLSRVQSISKGGLTPEWRLFRAEQRRHLRNENTFLVLEFTRKSQLLEETLNRYSRGNKLNSDIY